MISEFDLSFPLLFDEDKRLANALGDTALPADVVRGAGRADPGDLHRRRAQRHDPSHLDRAIPRRAGRLMVETFPDWWTPFRDRVTSARTEDFTRLTTPPEGGRPSAVLVLFAEETPGDPDVLVLQRAARHAHARGPTGVSRAEPPTPARPIRSTRRCARRPRRSGSTRRRSTCRGCCRRCSSRSAGSSSPRCSPGGASRIRSGRSTSPRSTSVHRVRIADLVDPRNRVRVRHPSGWVGPAFHAGDMLIWGFTAGILYGAARHGWLVRAVGLDRAARTASVLGSVGRTRPRLAVSSGIGTVP